MLLEQPVVDLGGTSDVAPEKPQVHHGKLVDPQGAQVLFDAVPQFGGLLRRQPVGLGVAPATNLGDKSQVLRVGVQRLPDEFVGDIRPVELGGIDVVDTEFDRAA